MSMYQPGIPTGRVQLDEDFLNVQHNFTQLNTTYGVDHYAYDNQTANNGFHNTVTTPLVVGGVHPTTAANVPKFYAMQQTVPVGVIQFSRAGSDAVPSPVTTRQSQATAITLNAGQNSANILDFTGLSRAIVKVFAGDLSNPSLSANYYLEYDVWWNGATMVLSKILPSNNAFQVVQNINAIRLFNNSADNFLNLFWTIQYLRLS